MVGGHLPSSPVLPLTPGGLISSQDKPGWWDWSIGSWLSGRSPPGSQPVRPPGVLTQGLVRRAAFPHSGFAGCFLGGGKHAGGVQWQALPFFVLLCTSKLSLCSPTAEMRQCQSGPPSHSTPPNQPPRHMQQFRVGSIFRIY